MTIPYSFYELQLFVLISFCLFAFLLERYVSSQKKKSVTINGVAQEEGRGSGWKVSNGDAGMQMQLAKRYLLVYALVMGADWLQGPYVYSLYHDQYKFPERAVAILFVTGFTSGGLTAPLVGVWADQHGRRRLCLAFCVTYALSCICTLFPSFFILLLGRILGGFSTSILFSCFESWLMSSSSSLALKEDELSNIMGRATLVNGFMATAAGVVSNKLVGSTHNYQTPFVASAVLLTLSWIMIKGTWGENYGSAGGGAVDPFQIARLRTAWRIVKDDISLLTLVMTQTCFEGSMYLFVFLWVPSLQDASKLGVAALPLGYIFSSFMVCMMLGSLIYTSIVSYPPPGNYTDTSVTLHAKLSSLICILSAIALFASVTTSDPRYRFWAFCVFEGCVGMYYPVQGMLRSTIIPNEHRATLSALSRVPLNIFVTVALLTGVSEARATVFGGCAAVLIVSALMTAVVIVRNAEETPTIPDSLND